ncbi:hypothetical protein ACROYT_G026965 [Oculina patagonica]
MRTLNHKTFESCTFSCELEPQCFSVNYISLHKTCQLNNATKEYFPGDLVKQKGAFYMGMVVRSYNPCESMRCENGGICVSSPSLKCECPKRFIGLHCETCISKPLGMEDGSITDNMISISSTHPNDKVAWGRLHCSLGSWTSYTDTGYQWFQVNFVPEVKLISHIATQGNGKMWTWVTRYYIMYKAGGAALEEYKKNNQRVIFQGNTNKDDVVKNRIGNPFQADTVRIIPTAYHGRIALRVELYGCDVM